jgi:hypothetical protein
MNKEDSVPSMDSKQMDMKTIESKAGNQNGSLYAYGSDRPRFDQQNSYDDDGLEA